MVVTVVVVDIDHDCVVGPVVVVNDGVGNENYNDDDNSCIDPNHEKEA